MALSPLSIFAGQGGSWIFSLLCWADARLRLHSPLNSSPPTTVEMLVTELEDTASELCTAHCELLSPGLLLQRFPCTAPRRCTTGVYLLLNWPLPGVEHWLPWKTVTANCYHRDNEVCLFSEASFKTLTVLFNLCSPTLILYTNATPVLTFVNKNVIMFLPFLFACHAEGSLV